MKILELGTGEEKEITITLVEAADLRKLTKKRYFFDWKAVLPEAGLYKLQLKGDEDIKGVMALIDYPKERRLEIKLLAASRENVIFKKDRIKQKEYERIAGNLIAFAARVAVSKYGSGACVSLLPKTELKLHYMREYGMMDGGYQVFLELRPLHDLIEKYIL